VIEKQNRDSKRTKRWKKQR